MTLPMTDIQDVPLHPRRSLLEDIWAELTKCSIEMEIVFKKERSFLNLTMKMIMSIRAPFSGVISNMTGNYVDHILSESDVLFILRRKIDYDDHNDLSPPSSTGSLSSISLPSKDSVLLPSSKKPPKRVFCSYSQYLD